MCNILLSLVIISSICITGKADQFYLTNAAYQSALDKELWEQIDAWPRGQMTNGLFCAARLLQGPETKSKLVCFVYVANTTTNSYHFLSLPDEATMFVALFDANGKRVAITNESQNISNWTQEKIAGWFSEHNHTHGVLSWLPPLIFIETKTFNISQMFQIKETGEYTLHLQIRLVEVNEDTANKFIFKSIWLPEVVNKFLIRPNDISLENLQPNNTTNSLAK